MEKGDDKRQLCNVLDQLERHRGLFSSADHASLRMSGTMKVWIKAIARTPPAIAVPPISTDPDFNAARPPRNAGIAEKHVTEWVVTVLWYDITCILQHC